jgi:hypothetical protein
MTIVVGTDTYLSLTDANTYWSNRNNADWSAASTAAKEAALREATQYVDGAFNFIGDQIITNVLAWPRYDVRIEQGNFAGVTYDHLTIPPQIKNAVAELALEALTARLAPSKERGGLVKREKVDVIEIEYMDFAPSGKSYSFVSMLLKPLTRGSKIERKVVR